VPRRAAGVAAVELGGQIGGEPFGGLGRLGRIDCRQLGKPSLGLVLIHGGFVDGRFVRTGPAARSCHRVLRMIHATHYPHIDRQERAMFPIRDLNPTRITPIVTIVIIAANLLVFLFQPKEPGGPAEAFVYENAAIACEITTAQPLSGDEIAGGACQDDNATAVFPGKNIWLAGLVSMFLHAGLFHVLGNMWFLWIFGNNVEEAFGTLGYVALYLVTGVAATGVFVAINPDATIPLVGASGAIAGVLGSYLVLFPTHRVLSLFGFVFVPIPAIIFLGVWLVSQFLVQGAGVAWEAHVGGFLAGVALTFPFRTIMLARIARLHEPRTSFLMR